jgi:hypothetical protein
MYEKYTKFLVRKPEGVDYMGDLGTVGRIMLQS